MKKVLIILCIVFLSTTILASDIKRGEFKGIKEVHLPNYTMGSFLDLHEDINNLKSQNKRLIMFVHQQNCPYCAKFSSEVLGDETIKQKVLQDFGMIEFNMFGNRDVVGLNGEELSEKEYAKILNIQFTPTTLFFDEEGKTILRLYGLASKEKFTKALEYSQKRLENEMSFNEFMKKPLNQEDRPLIAEDFFMKNSHMLARMGHAKELAVFFEQKGCKECEILHSTHLKDTLIRELLSKIEVAQIDVDMDRNIATPHKIIMKQKDWIETLNLTNFPTVIFFDEKGNEIIRMDANYKLFHTQSIIDYVVSGAYKEESEFQRYLTKRSNGIRDKGIDVDIWK